MKGLSIIRLNKHLYKEKFVPHQDNNIKCEKTEKTYSFSVAVTKFHKPVFVFEAALLFKNIFV